MVPLSCRSNLAGRYLEVGGRDDDGGVGAGRRHRRRHLDGGTGGLASGSRQHQLICEKKQILGFFKEYLLLLFKELLVVFSFWSHLQPAVLLRESFPRVPLA
jgi:hypothetical protein